MEVLGCGLEGRKIVAAWTGRDWCRSRVWRYKIMGEQQLGLEKEITRFSYNYIFSKGEGTIFM